MTSVYSTAEVVVPDNPPIPTGYHVLVILPKVEDKTKGGVLLPTDVKNREDIASIVAKVIAIGPDAYPENEFRFRFRFVFSWFPCSFFSFRFVFFSF